MPSLRRWALVQESLNPLEIALRQFDAAADRLGLDDGLRRVLRQPKRQLVVSVPTLMDNGSIRVFEGYRVQHSVTRGPSRGGVRFHPRLTLELSAAHALWTTWACAVARIPAGGANGGVSCDPKKMSRAELERMTRRYAAEIGPFVGPDRDVPGPDVSAGGQVMAWMQDTYAATAGRAVPMVTGKPAALGGNGGGSDAAARGALCCLREACQILRKPLRGATVALQGFGAVGSALARLLHDEGARVLAASDGRGGVHSSRGLLAPALIAHKAASGSVMGLKGVDHITNEELLQLKCDVLVPMALEGQITLRNASRVRARIVAEVAAGATTPGADRVLHDRGVLVVPDVLCGAGGVTGSYLESAQDQQGLCWEAAEVQRQIERFLRGAFHEVLEGSRRQKSDLRSAAHVLALSRLADATRTRGLFP